MAQLDVGQPFGYDVQEGSVDADGSTNESDDDPSLGSLVCGEEFMSPVDFAAGVQACGALLARFPALSFPCGILDPICTQA